MNYFHSSGVLLLLSKSGFYNKLELEGSMHVCSFASTTHLEQAGVRHAILGKSCNFGVLWPWIFILTLIILRSDIGQ